MDAQVHVMWVSPGFVSSNIRQTALDKEGQHAENLMDEKKMMPADECARRILRAIEKKKRTLVISFTGKRTVLMNRLFPSLTDKLVHDFYFKDGELIK
jgi:short-subunit dehydrogenase